MPYPFGFFSCQAHAVATMVSRSLWRGVHPSAARARALLATNRFAFPLPMAQFWVLSTYYVAQILIARHARPVEMAAATLPAAVAGLTPAR